MTEREAYIAFNMVPRIGSVKLAALIEKFGSAAAAWENFPHKTDWRKLPVDWQGEIAKAEKMRVKIITRADPEYPSRLDILPSSPLALYIVGEPAALSMPGVAVVGTRAPTLYGTDMAAEFSAGIVRNSMSVISGLAIGIDAAAHKGALSAGGITAGILGGAIDKFFPEDNRMLAREIEAKGGAVVSQFPFGFAPGKATFPQRNRIVAALSRGVLAIETPVQGGTLITCAIAKELEIPVMAVPGNLDSVNSAGCWKLIREGAKLVTSADEVTAICNTESGKRTDTSLKTKADGLRKTLSPSAVPPPASSSAAESLLTLEEAAVLKAIPSTGITLDRLSFTAKLPIATVNSITVALRLKKRIRYIPGNRVALMPTGALT